jgi:hypothetical protein
MVLGQIEDVAPFASELMLIEVGEDVVVLDKFFFKGYDALRQVRRNLEELGPFRFPTVCLDFTAVEAVPLDRKQKAAGRCVEPSEGVADRLDHRPPGFSEFFLERLSGLQKRNAEGARERLDSLCREAGESYDDRGSRQAQWHRETAREGPSKLKRIGACRWPVRTFLLRCLNGPRIEGVPWK